MPSSPVYSTIPAPKYCMNQEDAAPAHTEAIQNHLSQRDTRNADALRLRSPLQATPIQTQDVEHLTRASSTAARSENSLMEAKLSEPKRFFEQQRWLPPPIFPVLPRLSFISKRINRIKNGGEVIDISICGGWRQFAVSLPLELRHSGHHPYPR